MKNSKRTFYRVVFPGGSFSSLQASTLEEACRKLKEWGAPNPRMTQENIAYWAERRAEAEIVKVTEITEPIGEKNSAYERNLVHEAKHPKTLYDDQGFEKDTKAIRISYLMEQGGIRQSRVFFPNPTLKEALEEAKEFGRGVWSYSLSEAKRVRV